MMRFAVAWPRKPSIPECSDVVTRAQMIEAIEALPDDASYQDLLSELDRLDFIDAVERGLAAADAGDGISQDEVERRVAQWLEQSGQRQLSAS